MFERMTSRTKDGIAYTKIPANESNMVDVGGCYTGRIVDRIAAYEDIGKSPEEIISSLEDYKDISQQYANFVHEMQPLKDAKADGRLVVLPEGYEHAEELYHVVNLPKWCDEDGNGCEDCRHEVCNGDGASIDCTFKPYVSKIGANAVFDALYTLNGLSLSKESAEKALGGAEG